jgi:hypothetical protein
MDGILYLVAKAQKAPLDPILRVSPEFPVRAPTQSELIKGSVAFPKRLARVAKI